MKKLILLLTMIITTIFASKAQDFMEVTGTPFEGSFDSSIAFADVDGDMDQDVLITGFGASGQSISKLYTNDGMGGFALVTGTPFEGVKLASIAFADVDGDMDQDVLITGQNGSFQPTTKLYTNNGMGGFSLVAGTPFDEVVQGSIAFADVDGDMDQDVLITGFNASSERISKLYSNDGSGGFSLVSGTPFYGVHAGSIAFADVDGDMDQDVLITGLRPFGQRSSELYTNNGSGGFSLVTGTPFEGVSASSIAFADVDGDMDQDVLITGQNGSFQKTAKLYTNNGSGGFSLVAGTPFEEVISSSIAFADVDGDMDQDVLITGENASSQPIAKLYTNNGSGGFSLVANTPFQVVRRGSIAFTDVDGDMDQDVLITGLSFSSQVIAKIYAYGDFTAPVLQSFTRLTPNAENTNADEVIFLATFSEEVTNVDAADFAATGTTATVSIVQANTSTFQIKLSGGNLANLNGTVGLNVAVGQNIQDAADNALPNSEPATDEIYNLDNTAPVLQSFTRLTPVTPTTNADEVTFLATFNEEVSNVDASDFVPNGTTASVSIVQSNTSTFEIKLSGGDLAGLNGDVGLNLVASPSIQDLVGHALPSGEPATDEVYKLDNTAPVLQSFTRKTPSSENTNADEVIFLATFNETVSNLDANDFVGNGTTASVSIVQSNTSTFEIKLSGGNLANLNGDVGLNLVASPSIQDLVGNVLPSGEPTTDEIYKLDNLHPIGTNFSPNDNAMGVAITDNLVLTFSKVIQKGTGNILIKRVSDNSIFETIDVTAANVVISSNAATINPTNTLAQATAYYVEIATTCFNDLAGNNYGGISTASIWNFETIFPSVSVVLQNGSMNIGENSGTDLVFRFSRTGLTTEDLIINYSIGGTAVNNDFNVMTNANTTYISGTKKGTIKIPTGSAFADLIIGAATDTMVESNETIGMKIESSL